MEATIRADRNMTTLVNILSVEPENQQALVATLRDFDSVRDMLADDVRLDLVNRLRLKGRSEAGRYFRGYAEASHWHCVPGLVDGRAAILMFDPNDPAGPPTYFILLEWTSERVAAIRDFLFARYAVEGAEIVALG